MTSVESVDQTMTDRMWSRITRALVDTGRPPHYAELARALGVSPAESRAILHAVLQAYPIGWVHPDTDYIASFPPLNGLPTQYRVTVRGEQKWFAQCGFEATSVTWLFPGERVRSTSPVSTAAIRSPSRCWMAGSRASIPRPWSGI